VALDLHAGNNHRVFNGSNHLHYVILHLIIVEQLIEWIDVGVEIHIFWEALYLWHSVLQLKIRRVVLAGDLRAGWENFTNFEFALKLNLF
jgi:hypothetical protein